MDTQELITLFRERGYKVTTQRLAICKFILSRKDHPTAEKIYQGLRKEHPTISLGTIYKTLHLLKELGLIQELGFEDGSVRYDPDTELHINLVCSNCGEIRDYKAENIENYWTKIISEIDVKPKGQRIDVYYDCQKCR